MREKEGHVAPKNVEKKALRTRIFSNVLQLDANARARAQKKKIRYAVLRTPMINLFHDKIIRRNDNDDDEAPAIHRLPLSRASSARWR